MVRQTPPFDGLAVFVCVAELRSFSAAAARLGISPSAASQAIRALEQRVGAPLLNRTTRSVSLTEAGARYLERVAPALRELTAASEELVAVASRPRGSLRLNVPRAAYTIVLQPLLAAFLRRYPEIELEIAIDSHLIDIVAGGFDAGIRFGDRVDRDMVGVRVGPKLSAHIVAAPAYLARRGLPVHPRDLADHDCVGFRHVTSGQVERWEFARSGERLDIAVRGRLVLNDSAALVQAALDGIGIVYMINGPIDRLIEDGRLVRLLADWSPDLPGLSLYYPNRRRVPASLRALIDFVRRRSPDVISHEI